MPIVRLQARCGAPNAFRLRFAVWKLYLEQPLPLQQRSLTSTPSTRGREVKKGIAKPIGYVNTSSLVETLQNIRNQNRDSLVRRVRARPDFHNRRPNHPDLNPEKRKQNLEKIWKKERARENEATADRSSTTKTRRAVTDALFTKFSSIPERGNLTSPSKPIQEQKNEPETLEYQGKYVLPVLKNETPAREYPWMEGQEKTWGSTRLNNEIKLFWEYMKPTATEQAAREAVVRQTSDIIRRVLPDYMTETFGSQRTGLALATSDIDIRLYGVQDEDSKLNMAPQYKDRRKLSKQIDVLFQHFFEHPDYILVRRRHSRYPLISIQHRASGYDIQIVCSNDTSVSRSLTKGYLESDPDIYPIFALSKVLLDIRGLSDVFRGGIGSYSLFMMIVAALKRKRHFGKSEAGVAIKFVAFLHFYADYAMPNIDPYNEGLAVDPPLSFRKLQFDAAIAGEEKAEKDNDPILAGRYRISLQNKEQPYLLCLQDPADPRNDLGRRAYGCKHIFATFRHLRGVLQAFEASSPNADLSMLGPLVGSCYHGYRKRREVAEDFGRRVLDTDALAADRMLAGEDAGDGWDVSF